MEDKYNAILISVNSYYIKLQFLHKNLQQFKEYK